MLALVFEAALEIVSCLKPTIISKFNFVKACPNLLDIHREGGGAVQTMF